MKKDHLAHETRLEHRRTNESADSKAKALVLESADELNRKRSRFLELVLVELRKQKARRALESE